MPSRGWATPTKSSAMRAKVAPTRSASPAAAQRGPRLHGFDDERHQVVPAPGAALQRVQGAPSSVLVAVRADPGHPLGQRLAHAPVDLEEVGGRHLLGDELVYADHGASLVLDLTLPAVG